MYQYIHNTIRGLFLLILAVGGNFLAPTLSCQTQKLLDKSVPAKHIVLITILYFSIHFTKEAEHVHPWKLFVMAVVIYMFFLCFTKMDIVMTIIVFIMLTVVFIISTFIDYYSYRKQTKNVSILKHIQTGLIVLMFVLTVVGFCIYFRRQLNDHKDSFSFIKFIFGSVKCDFEFQENSKV